MSGDNGNFDSFGDTGGSFVAWVVAQIIIGSIDWMLYSVGADPTAIVAVTVVGEGITTYQFLGN